MAVSWFPAAYQWGKISWSFFFFCVVSQRAPKDASATAITVWILLGNIWGSWNSTGLFSFSAAKWKQGGNQRTAGAARPRDEPNLCTKTSFSCTLAVILTICLQQLCFWWEGGQQEVVAPPQTAQALTQQRTICSKITKARLKSGEKNSSGEHRTLSRRVWCCCLHTFVKTTCRDGRTQKDVTRRRSSYLFFKYLQPLTLGNECKAAFLAVTPSDGSKTIKKNFQTKHFTLFFGFPGVAFTGVPPSLTFFSPGHRSGPFGALPVSVGQLLEHFLCS